MKNPMKLTDANKLTALEQYQCEQWIESRPAMLAGDFIKATWNSRNTWLRARFGGNRAALCNDDDVQKCLDDVSHNLNCRYVARDETDGELRNAINDWFNDFKIFAR